MTLTPAIFNDATLERMMVEGAASRQAEIMHQVAATMARLATMTGAEIDAALLRYLRYWGGPDFEFATRARLVLPARGSWSLGTGDQDGPEWFIAVGIGREHSRAEALGYIFLPPDDRFLKEEK